MRLRTAILLTALAWTGIAANQTPLTAEQRRLAAESFEYVWTTVRDKHWDPKLGGLDWQGMSNLDEPQGVVFRIRDRQVTRLDP